MTCSKCGGATELRKGVSKKNGKPWQGFKCLACDNMDFVKDKPGTTTIIKETGPLVIKPPVNGEAREKAMFYSYAKDLAIAEIQAGLNSGPIVNLTKMYFRDLWSDYTNPLK